MRRIVLVAATLIAIGVLAAAPALAAPSGWLALDGNERYAGGSAVYDWGNSGAASPVSACPSGAVNVTGSGGLFNCGAPNAGSAPPNPPALTPAAAADPSIISARFIVDPISTDVTACGSGDPTVITGGSKNGDPISSYASTTGSVPDKDELGNVFAISHTRADNGHPELYFGAERLVNNGDSHVDFEFLQSIVTLSAPCSGSFAGHRTEGDLLAAVDFTVGGSSAGITLWQWHCAAEPGPQPPDGTVCDPTGVQHYEQIVSPAISFLVNAATIACGGWVCRDKITGNTTQIAANDLLEGGIDLLSLPFTGCFNSFLPHTRTAQSFTAGLKDFTGPVPLRSCRDPLMATTSAPTGGGVAQGSVARDSLTIGNGGAGPLPTGSVSFFLCGPADSTAAGCPSGGSQVGAARPLTAGSASSDAAPPASVPGLYCWRAEYAPDAASQGVFAQASHTDSGSECFSVPVPGFPDTGMQQRPPPDFRLALVAVFALLVAGLGWQRRPR